MKKILLLIFVAICVVSCEKEEDRIPEDKHTEYDGLTSEQIFNLTGCKPTDANNVKSYKLYKDKDSTKYLYGSKNKDGVESFWFATYNSIGEQQWEIIHKDAQFASHAYGPVQIANGDIVVNNVTKEESFALKGASPVIINKNGEANYLQVFNGYYYTDVYPFDDFFFCDVNDIELGKVSAKEWCTQISNDGKILNQGKNLNIPNGKFIWIGNNYFIKADNDKIERQGVLSEADSTWIFPLNKNQEELQEPKISIEGDSVLVNYNLLQEGNNITKSYKLSCTTGMESNTKDEEEEDEIIKVLVYGSMSSINGLTTGDVTATFYNNSSKSVTVKNFKMYDTYTNKVVFEKNNCGNVLKNNPLKYDIKFSGVYKPLYIWIYECEGVTHEIKYQNKL